MVMLPWRSITIAALLLAAPAQAQQQAPAQQPAQPQQPPPQQMPAQQNQESNQWAKMPRMVLERQFAGPLQDTIIQRWRDPVDGTACYLYLPITAAHTATTPSGFVQYGANTIGSISCVAPAAAAAPAPRRPPAPPAH